MVPFVVPRGAIFAQNNPTWLGRLIVWGQRVCGQAPQGGAEPATHVGIVGYPDDDGVLWVWDSRIGLRNGVRYRPMSLEEQRGTRFMLPQGWAHLTSEDKARGFSVVRAMYGGRYDWLGVVTFGLVNTRRNFCSEVVHSFLKTCFSRPGAADGFASNVWPWKYDPFFTPNDAVTACEEPLAATFPK